MGGNSFGKHFVVTSFGESHGPAMGVVIDGCPAGLEIDMDILKADLSRRRPGQSELVTARNELDEPEILSGVFQGKTIGSPITVVIRNKDQKSEDYEQIKSSPRRGHADDIWLNKYGHSDYRGGGRASGRETVSRVIAGSFAKMLLKKLYPNLSIYAFSKQIFEYELNQNELSSISPDTKIDNFPARFPELSKAKKIEELLLDAKKEGKSYGGIVEFRVENMIENLGQAVFHKLKSELSSALLSIGATTGVSFGDAENAANTEGVEFHNQSISPYGGLRGGMSTGETILGSLTFKPTSTVLDNAKKGRHDPCILPRAIPVVEAMIALTIIDHLLWSKLDRLDGL
ncbi:MAG: chorismate synthase [Bdellovibrionales bacterium]